MPTRIAVIDDELVFLDLLHEVLSDEGYEPHIFADGAAAYPRVRELAPAAIIGVALRSPFGEAERAAGSSLPALRGCHLVGLLLVAGLALAVANRAATGPDFDWLLVRNAAGYCGLALLGGRLSGAALSWLTPFLYGLFATVAPGGFLPRESRWLWPIQPPDVYAAAIIACVLLGIGLLVGVVYGTRPVADEQG